MQCAKCRIDKNEEAFYFNKKRDQLHVWCRECSAEYARGRRKTKMALGGVCSSCLKPSEKKNCDVCALADKRIPAGVLREKTQRWRDKNPEYSISSTRARKMRVLEAYGGLQCHCVGCDITEFEFLTIDHIDGGGSKHREKIHNIYSWLIRNEFPKGFRVLCMNCNLALGRYGYCPHQTEQLNLSK